MVVAEEQQSEHLLSRPGIFPLGVFGYPAFIASVPPVRVSLSRSKSQSDLRRSLWHLNFKLILVTVLLE